MQRWRHPIPLRPLLAKIDYERLRDIQARYTSSSGHYAKYLDVEQHLRINIRRVQDLGLHRSPPQKVLDIGPGGGFFLFILKQFRHSCLGLDTNEFPVFSELMQLFGVPRKTWTIRAFERLPDLGRKFDLITAFSAAFQGRDMHPWQWGAEEWSFFLDDLNRHLKTGGRIVFALNPSYEGRYYTAEIVDLFLRRGAAVERENVIFPAKK
ncbi:MAG: hypothetical protein QOI22_1454 [Verrucomicrobiota bacterium]